MLDPGIAAATSAPMSFMLLELLSSLLRASKADIAGWFGANLAVMVALPLILLRGRIPDTLSVVVVNVLLALGGAIYYANCTHFLGYRPQWPILLAGVTAVGVVVIYWRYIVDSIPMRVSSTMLSSGAFCTTLVWMLLRHSSAGRSTYPYRVTTIIAFVSGVCQLMRGIYFLTLHATSNPGTFATTGSVLLLVVAAAIIPTLSMSAMLIVHDALLTDVRDAANRGFLTDALSRQGFKALTRRHVGRVLRHARPLALLILDLDHFKRTNDTLGHAAGGTVLRASVQMAQAQLRPADVLGRISDEEFVLLLPDTDSGNTMHLTDQLRKTTVAHIVTASAQSCRYGLSGGVAVWQPGESFDQLSARTDRVLYDAKHQGRDRICTTDVVNVAAVAQRHTQDDGNPRGCCRGAV